MLTAASEAIHELNKMELLPLIGFLMGLVWFVAQPNPGRIGRKHQGGK